MGKGTLSILRAAQNESIDSPLCWGETPPPRTGEGE